MRWKIIILYLTCTWLNGTLLQKLAPSLKRDPNRITWPCGKGSLEGSLNPTPTPPPPTPYTTPVHLAHAYSDFSTTRLSVLVL